MKSRISIGIALDSKYKPDVKKCCKDNKYTYPEVFIKGLELALNEIEQGQQQGE